MTYCWNVRDSMYAGTLYNGYWSEYLAGFSHCSVKSSRQLQLLLSTGYEPGIARIPLPVVIYWRLPSQLLQERVAVLYIDDSPAWVVAKAFILSGYSRVAVHESTTDKRTARIRFPYSMKTAVVSSKWSETTVWPVWPVVLRPYGFSKSRP